MVVLVTGASGQLGQALRKASVRFPELEMHFASSAEADITDKHKLDTIFASIKPDYCINAAAYTAVDKSESEAEIAHLVNVTGAANLAHCCNRFETILIHISTDFVFDGTKNFPYVETDATNPQGIYGQTKNDGEQAIRDILAEHFIVRTSWLYSEFGNNFMKTMLRLASERSTLNVVNDQIGTPTNANDLAEASLSIIQSKIKTFGTYHYSNEGSASWYDFAKEIFLCNGIKIDLKPIPTSEFPTPAKRPAYSVLDKSKIKQVFGLQIKDWRTSLKEIKV